MKPALHSAASLEVRIRWEDGGEKVIGFASGLQYQVNHGQKPIMVVDSPFPAEIAQAAGPAMVNGSMTVFLPKGVTLETTGLIPKNIQDTDIAMARSQSFDLRIYNRETDELVLGVDGVKVGSYTVNMMIRSLITISLSFMGRYAREGVAY